MTVLYDPEYNEAKDSLIRALIAGGIPRSLWPNYSRLMAEEIACMIADKIVGDATKRELEEKQREFERQAGQSAIDKLKRELESGQ